VEASGIAQPTKRQQEQFAPEVLLMVLVMEDVPGAVEEAAVLAADMVECLTHRDPLT
jgi:hypothetical protein